MRSEVPSGWRVAKLAEVTGRITSGGTPKSGKPEYYNGGLIPFLKIDDISTNGGIHIREAKQHITPLAVTETSVRVYPAGTVLCTMYGTIGAVAITDVELAANQAIAAFMDLKGVTPEYLAYALSFEAKRLANRAGQTTQANISLGTLRGYSVPLPPLPEQKKIAAILSSVDEAIQATRAVIEQARRVKEGLLQDLLTRGIGHTRFQEKEVGEFPEGWLETTLSSLGDGTRPAVKAGPFGSALKKAFYTRSGYRVYGQEQVLAGSLSVGHYYIDAARFETLRSCEVRPGDVLISLVGTVGRSLVVPREAEPGIINPRLIRLSPSPRRALSQFLAFWLEAPQTRQALSNHSQGGTMDVLNARMLSAIPLLLPPLAEQGRISKILSSVDEALADGVRRARHLHQVKAGLLQDLLTGKVRVTA